jgi:hypothetical protein
MDAKTRTTLTELASEDKQIQNDAFSAILAMTEGPVDWTYEVWDDMVKWLSSKDNHLRAISAQILCNLAKSDPDLRMLKDFAALLAVTRDERFVTARHCLQALWKIGLAGTAQKKILVDGLVFRYNECISEKNCTLIRYDIIQDIRNLYNAARDESLKEKALELIATEDDLKYRKKYSGLWKSG